jgi:hypothetical protein
MQRALYVLLGVLLVPTMGLVGDIVTDGKFKSTQPSGAPLEVASDDMVANLNADMVDGVEGTNLYTKAEVDTLVAAANGGRIAIGPTTSFPIVIDEPGSYVLTADLNLTEENINAIEINADDVTLDLSGHVIQGPNAPYGKGIYSINSQNLTVHDGIIRGFYDGIYVWEIGPTGGCIIQNITAGNNIGYGIFVHRAVVENCLAYSNTDGGIVVGDGSVVRGSSALENGSAGISLSASSAIDCVARGNESHGIHIGSLGLVSGCNISDNGGYGIYMEANSRSNVVNSVGYGNVDGNVVNCGVGNGCHQNYLP